MIRQDFAWPLDPRFLLLPMLIVLVARSAALMYYGAYQGVFAYFGLWDLSALCKAVSLSGVIAAGLTFFVGLQSFPRSVFIIDWAIVLFMLSGVRYGLRIWVRHGWRQRGQRRQKALVVGAGVGGESIARTLLEDPLCPYRPVGFIDEVPERWGSLIHGVRVLGGAAELPLAVSANRIQAVFVCMSDLSDHAAREVVGRLRAGRRGVSDRPGPERPAQQPKLWQREKRTGNKQHGCCTTLATAGSTNWAGNLRTGKTIRVHRGSDNGGFGSGHGGAGYVGSHLTRKLLARGHRVRVLDNFVYGTHGLDESAITRPRVAERRHLSTTRARRALQGLPRVVALAAIVGDAACDLDPSARWRSTTSRPARRSRPAAAATVERLVFASSCSVYGANGSDFLHERSHLNPVSLYARTRIMSEELLLSQQDVDVIILRLATVCGVSPRMRFDLMVNTMTACATAQAPIRVSGAKQWRPHLHVQDAAEAFRVAVEAPTTREKTFNVGSTTELHRRRSRRAASPSTIPARRSSTRPTGTTCAATA
jgi:nucleoside-diphosphate-sugar epimerase